MRCAIYTRISKADDGDESSTDRQERNCRDLVRAREWELGEVFTDIDTSAYVADTFRPGLEALLGEVEAGAYDAVVVWRLDRLTRRSVDFERIWGICEAHNVALVSVTEPVDTSSPIGVAVVRMLVTFAGLESTVRSQRLAAKHLEDARAGIPRSTHRPFGFNRDMTPRGSEAELIREAGDRILDGESVSEIVADWNARGLRSARGALWVASSLRQIMTAPRLVGDRSHKDEVVASDCWPALLDRDTALRIRSALAGGRVMRKRQRDHPAVLADLVVCRECDGPLEHRMNNDVRRYRCQKRWGGCGAVSIKADDIETWVEHHVRWRLARRGNGNGRRVAHAVDNKAVTAALTKRESTLHRINVAYFVGGELTQPEWRRLRRQALIASEIEVLEIDPEFRPGPLPAGLSWNAIAQQWSALSGDARRGAIAAEIREIAVAPAPRRYGWFDPSRLTVDWIRDAEIGPEPDGVAPTVLWVYKNRQPQVPDWIPPATELRAARRPLNAPEACRVADTYPKDLQRAVRQGRLRPCSPAGAPHQFTVEALDEWMRTRPRRAAYDSSPSSGG